MVSALLHRGLPRWEERPSTVLLVTSDTHRADHVGFTGGDRGALTPALNALAARGTVFEDAISATSITNPSHASIFTGLPVRDTGVVGNVELLSERAVTLAETFQDAGYRTVAAVSARHLTPWRSGLGQGFEVFDSPSEGMTRGGKATVEAVRELLAGAEGPTRTSSSGCTSLTSTRRISRGRGSRSGTTRAIRSRRRSRGWTRARWPSGTGRSVTPSTSWPSTRARSPTWTACSGSSSRRSRASTRASWPSPPTTGRLLGRSASTGTTRGSIRARSGCRCSSSVPGSRAGRTVRTPVENRALASTLHKLALGAEENPFQGRSLMDGEVLDGDLEEPRYVLGANALSAGAFADRWYLLLHLKKKGWGNPPGLPAHSVELYDLDRGPRRPGGRERRAPRGAPAAAGRPRSLAGQRGPVGVPRRRCADGVRRPRGCRRPGLRHGAGQRPRWAHDRPRLRVPALRAVPLTAR